MASNTLKQDSTKTFKSINYQYLVALEKCFEMQGDESVWVEKYGDITSSNGTQIEVKDYQKDLTDLDHNIWNTLKNWMNDDFEVEHYNSFILLTTQKLSENSKFLNWNNKNAEKKFAILNEINNNYKGGSEKTKKLLDIVLNKEKQEKLLYILERFIIVSKNESDEELYKRLIETRTDGVADSKKEEYINALLGYIINPSITSNGWEIKNKDFRAKTKSLIETMTANTKIMPKIQKIEITNEVIDKHKDYLFIEKIKEIEYNEVISDAISDFLYTRKMINEELKNYEIDKTEYEAYESNILRRYKGQYRKNSRNITDEEKIAKSQNFYDDITSEYAPNFYNFNDTSISYRNGILHELANDSENPKKVIWKLGEKNE